MIKNLLNMILWDYKSTTGGLSFGLGNAIVQSWGGASVYAGFTYMNYVFKTALTRYVISSYPPTNFEQIQLSPKIGLDLSWFYFRFGPSFILSASTDLDIDPSY
jgi:hypothetical protein